MPPEVEHAGLLNTARRVVADLESFNGRLETGEVAYAQHFEFGKRAQWLSYLLSAALSLTEQDAYPAAFAVLRSALEHHIIDVLLFLGDRYQQFFTGVSVPEWQSYQAARAAGEEWTRDVIDWQWQDGTLKVVKSGLHFDTGGAETLSIYYGFLEQFDPFQGPPEDQKYLTTGFTTDETLHERWARKQRSLYGEGLRWKRLGENLVLNGLYDDKTLAQLNVHFRFLSAFVHPVSEAYILLYGHNTPTRPQGYDHFASELALLYVNTFAARELRALVQMSTAEPRVGIGALEDLRTDMTAAEVTSSHLWFPGGMPHDFDRVEEANHRGVRDGLLVPTSAADRRRPEEFDDAELHYYRNPLIRIRKMHFTAHEMTGFSYVSPWHRSDAGPF
jgi:hypothetical protein